MDVEFKFGSDGSELLRQLKQIKEEFSLIRDETTQAKASMQESFRATATSGDEAQKQLARYMQTVKQQEEIISSMQKKLEALEKGQSKAFDAEAAKKYEAEIKKLQAEITALKDAQEKFGASGKNSARTVTIAMAEFVEAVEQAKQKLSTMTIGSGEYKKLEAEIRAAEVAQQGMTTAVDEAGNAVGGSRTELRLYRETLIQLKKDGLDQTQVYKDLKAQAGELADTIGDVNEEFKASGSDTAGIDRMVRSVQLATNAFALYQGVMALTGIENEEFEKTLVQLNGLMVVTNSLQQVMTELKRKDNVLTGIQAGLQKVYALAVGTSTGALKAFRIALASTGVGLIVILLSTLVMNWDKVTKSIKESLPELEGVGKAFDRVKQVVAGVGNAIVQYFLGPLRAAVNFIQGDFKAGIESLKNSFDVVGNYMAGADAQLDAQNEARRRASLEKSIKFYQDHIAVLQAQGKNTAEVQRAIFKLQAQQYEEGSGEMNDLMQQRRVFEAGEAKRLEDLRRQNAEKARQDAEKARQEREQQLQYEMQLAEKITDLENKIITARIENMKEGREREIAAEKQSLQEFVTATKDSIAKYEDELKAARTETARAAITQLIKLENDAMEQEQRAHHGRLLAIDSKYYQDAQKLFNDAMQGSRDMLLQGQDRELADIEKRYDAILNAIDEAKKKIEQNLKDGVGDASLNEAELEQLERRRMAVLEKYENDRAKVMRENRIKRLEDEEELATAEAEILEASGLTQKELEELKEKAKLQIIIDYAQRKLDILEATGDKEYALQIAQLKKVIADAKAELAKPSEVQYDIFTLLGLQDLTENEKRDIEQSAKAIVESVASIFNDGIQSRINSQQRLIEELNKGISEQENIADRERDLMEKGYANNYAIEQQKLNDLKKNKEEEAEELRRFQREQQRLAQVQMGINAVMTSSNLIFTAAEYFKGGAKFGPLIGSVISLAAIATMMAAFAGIKAKAKEASQFRHGGGFDLTGKGSRHEQGGIVVMDRRSGKELAEAETGEYGFIFKDGRKARQYEGLFEKINRDEVGNMTYEELMKSLNKPFDFGLNTKIIKETSKTARETKLQVTVIKDDEKTIEQLVELNQKVDRLEKKTGAVTTGDGYRIERSGNHIRKIRTDD